MSSPKIKIVFHEDVLGDLEGEGLTQEEIDELVAKIYEMAEDGSLFDEAVLIEDEDEIDYIMGRLEKRKLQ